MTRIVEGVGHKLYTDNLFSSPDLFDDLAQKKNLLLWDRETTYKGNAQGPNNQDI